MEMRRSHTRDMKIGVCRDILEGRTTKAQAIRRHELAPSMLDRWLEQYRKLGGSAFPNSPSDSEGCASQEHRVRELEALVGRMALEMEFMRAALKKGRELREKRPK